MAKRCFRHTGGGCVMGKNVKYPCDDEYIGGKKAIEVISTKEAHFNMPDKVCNASVLKRKKGVKSVRTYDWRE